MNHYFAQKWLQWWWDCGDTQPLQDGEKIGTLRTYRWWGCKNFSIISSSLELVLVLELALELELELVLELELAVELELILELQLALALALE